MKKLILQTITLFYFCSYFTTTTQAQIRPISNSNLTMSPTCIGCTVSAPENARDIDPSNSAIFDVTGLPLGVLGFVSMDYSFASALPADDELLLHFSFSDNSLLSALGTDVANLAIFSRLKVELLQGGTVGATYGGLGLLDNIAAVELINPTTATFNVAIKVPLATITGVRISTGALVSAATGTTPSNLEVHDIISVPTNRYYANEYTGNSGQVGAAFLPCFNCQVIDPSLGATYTADPNYQYTKYRWDVGLSLLGTEYQYAEYDWGASPVLDFLGDQDGGEDELVVILQESGVADLGLQDLGLNLWSSGGVSLLLTYTDLSTELLSSSSSLVAATVVQNKSGRFQLTRTIPSTKTLQKVEVRRVAPSLAVLTELRLYSIYTTPTSATLPEASITSFKIDKKNRKDAVLKWCTNALEGSSFEVQQASDKLSFEAVTTIDATTDRNYSLTQNDLMGGAYYYRIKTTSPDGIVDYSPTKVVVFETTQERNIYQTNQTIWIEQSEPLPNDCTVIISTTTGQVLTTAILPKGSIQNNLKKDPNWTGTLLFSIIDHQGNIITQILP